MNSLPSRRARGRCSTSARRQTSTCQRRRSDKRQTGGRPPVSERLTGLFASSRDLAADEQRRERGRQRDRQERREAMEKVLVKASGLNSRPLGRLEREDRQEARR